MISPSLSLSQQTRIFLSLASIFFFAPYVQFFLKRTNLAISQEDRQYIAGYVKIGYFSLILGLLVAILGAYNFVWPTLVVALSYTIVMYVLVGWFIIGSLFVFMNTSLIKHTNNIQYSVSKIEQPQKDVLKSFLPGYNIYLWYRVHSFSHPFWALKESLLWTLALVIAIVLSGSPFLVMGIILLTIIRLITLMSGYDILPGSWKMAINRLFLVNIEELWGDCIGAISYGWHHYIVKHTRLSLLEHMQEIRKKYTQLYSFTGNNGLRIEYALLGLLLGGWLYHMWTGNLFGIGFGIQAMGILLISIRYIVMIPYKQYPLIPFVHEVVEGGFWLTRKCLNMLRTISPPKR